MVDAFGLLGLLLLLFGGGKSSPERAPRAPLPRQLPPGVVPTNVEPLPPAPWPQVVPSGLPPFPGSGWEYDEPPPVVVQQRAGQLLSSLWARGAGTFKIEQTAGRWVAYRAEKVKSGKQGVVAYRQATKKPLPVPAGAQSRAPAAPAAPRAAAPAASPGVPQARPAASQALPAVSPLGMRDLKIGAGMKPAAPDPDVLLVQQKLGVVPADGRFGKDTQTAVIKFQVRTGLAPDLPVETLRTRGFGAVKQATWVKLFAVRV
jgi:peptidoglycan hydrolase-like protein with peptidoglycan-binding domain